MKRFQRDKTNVLQFVSILTVDPDSPSVWHARVGFLEPIGEWADRFVPMRTWTAGMELMAREEIAELLKLPRQDVTIASGIRPKGNPTNLHGFVRLTEYEASWMRGVQDGTIEKTVKLIRTMPAGMPMRWRTTGSRRETKMPAAPNRAAQFSAASTLAGGMKKKRP